MKNPIKTMATCLGLFILFVLIKVPANQVIPRLSLPQDVALSGLSGSLWQGKAEQFTYKGLLLNNVQWQLDFLPLLIGNLSVSLKAGNTRDPDQISVNGDFTFSSNSLSASSASLFAPTPMLMAQVQLPVPVKAGGRVKLDIDEMDYQSDQGCIALSGKGHWLKGSVAGFNKEIPLGNFEADLLCDNGPITITTNPQNSLNLAGTATISHPSKISVSGKFKVSDDLPREVHNAAQFFGNKDAQGFYSIQL